LAFDFNLALRYIIGMNIVDKIKSRIIIDNTTNCWLWQGAKDGCGYGFVYIKPKTQRTHRAMYEYYYGEIPKGLLACHKCDVPSCVNPDHIFLGTPKDNYVDMHKKGRAVEIIRRGESHKLSKLTEADVINIRTARGRHKDIGSIYGVSGTLVGNIKNRKTWKHVI